MADIASLKSLVKRHLPSSVWVRLQLVRRRARAARFRRRVVTHQYGRSPLTLSLEDPTGAAWYDRDWPQSSELDLLTANRLVSGARVFDLGAHQGVIALMLAAIVGPEGLVIAVEPDASNVAVAERNRRLNHAENVVILHAAVAETSGSILFDTVEAHLSPRTVTANTKVVSAVTIDELTARFGVPDVVYVDIEGFEGRALNGAARTIAETPDWFIEVHAPASLARFESSVDDILGRFRVNGYDLMGASSNNEPFESLEAQPSVLFGERFFLFARRALSREPSQK